MRDPDAVAENSTRQPWRLRARRGAVLVWFALTFIGLLGMMGLTVDVGRMYIARTETQSFVDAGALSAAAALDGTGAGITTARATAAAAWTKYHFGANTFAAPTVEFAKSGGGSWDSYATAVASPTDYRFVQVTENISLPMTLMPVITDTADATIAARARAGQVGITGASEGLFPFSVIAHSGSKSAGYGLTPGMEYTMRWGAGSNSDLANYSKTKNINLIKTFCSGDRFDDPFLMALNAAVQSNVISLTERGFLEGNASDLKAAVENGYQTDARNIGDPINLAPGSKQTISDYLNNRIGFNASVVPPSSDGNHYDYATSNNATTNLSMFYEGAGATPRYWATGNGRRVVIAPILRAPADGSQNILDFGLFLLRSKYDGGGNDPWCAMYLGSGVEGLYHRGVATAGLYAVRLIP